MISRIVAVVSNLIQCLQSSLIISCIIRKKDKKFQNYAIDQNGKFFVKKNGYDDRYYPVSSIEDIEKLIENN